MKFYFKKHSILQWTVKNIKEYNPLTDCIKRKIYFKNVISQRTLLKKFTLKRILLKKKFTLKKI